MVSDRLQAGRESKGQVWGKKWRGGDSGAIEIQVPRVGNVRQVVAMQKTTSKGGRLTGKLERQSG